MPGIAWNDDDWPVIVYRYEAHFTDADVVAMVANSAQLLRRRAPHAVVMDMSQTAFATAKQRKISADWTRKHADELARYRVGTAFAIRSSFMRGVITAVYWMTPAPYPIAVFEERDDAAAWCRRRLLAVGRQTVDLDAGPR